MLVLYNFSVFFSNSVYPIRQKKVILTWKFKWALSHFLQFQRGNQKHNSTHRVDFRNYEGHRPDVVVRRKALLRNDGLGTENLFWHHGKRYTNNMLSWYDEHYNGRWKENDFPPSRQWNSHQLAWGPERSDYPLQGIYIYIIQYCFWYFRM
jgi:hypothetical protein